MMFMRRLVGVLLVLGLLVLVLAMGCGPKPPCAVPTEQVKQAQARTQEVQTEQASTEAEIAKTEKELKDREAELQQLQGKPEELEKKLENLKKGSGRK